ncbi:hypothetical protein [Cupriavidus taiwanensis]|uniref:hypothetical protein n=1 Tax=Cupriavidus taiwanensis TaxID=164546 RepID=UPI0011AE544D|nr:hypothetical protein [Cupriavidus taiwanensis]
MDGMLKNMNGTIPNVAASGSPSQEGAAMHSSAVQSATAQTGASGQQQNPAFLGLSVDQLAGLSVDEIKGNKVAITMLLHYYTQLSEENTSLRNERNTLSTYVTGYQQKKSDARIGAVFSAVSTVLMGFGVNLLTGDAPKLYGMSLFIPAIIMMVVGLWFSLREEEA